jgi:hypothetical protein
MHYQIYALIIGLPCILLSCNTDSGKATEMCHASIVMKLVDPGTGQAITDAKIWAFNTTLGDSSKLPLAAHNDSLYRIYGKPGEYNLKLSHSTLGDFVLSPIPVSDTLMDGQPVRNTTNLEVRLEKEASGQPRILKQMNTPKC